MKSPAAVGASGSLPPQYIASKPGTGNWEPGTGNREPGTGKRTRKPLHWAMQRTSPTTLQLIGQLSTIGLSFVFALVIGFAAGYWLDGVLGTKPWLSFVGFFLGLAAGVLNVYRVMQLANKDRSGSSGSTVPKA